MVVVLLDGSVIVQPGQLPTGAQLKTPFEPLAAIVKLVVPLTGAHLACGGPARTVGVALTVRVTSAVGAPQLALVSVARNVQVEATLPPEYTMVVVGLDG